MCVHVRTRVQVTGGLLTWPSGENSVVDTAASAIEHIRGMVDAPNRQHVLRVIIARCVHIPHVQLVLACAGAERQRAVINHQRGKAAGVHLTTYKPGTFMSKMKKAR